MINLVRKTGRDIVVRKFRSALTVLGVVIGVAGVVTIVSTAQNLTHAQARAFANTSQADVTFWVGDAPSGLERALRAVPNVAQAELRVTYSTKWKIGPAWRDIYFIGIADFGNVQVNRVTLKAGRYPALGECLLETSVRELAPVDIGQEITVRAGPENAKRYLTVSGFARSPTYLSSQLTNFAVAYAPAATVRRMVGIAGSNQILLKLADLRDADDTVRAVERLLDRRGLVHGRPTVRDPFNYPGRRELNTLLTVMVLFSGLGLAISGFLVANTLSALVAEQIREIGMLKALGATRGQVLGTYLVLSLLYGLAGTALGVVVGSVAQGALSVYIGRLANVDVPFRLSPQGVGLGVVVGVGVTVLAGLGPAWRGSQLTPTQALGHRALAAGSSGGWWERVAGSLEHLPPLAGVALRNLGRRRMRNVVTLGVIVLATAAYLAAQSAYASVAGAIHQIFGTYDADAWVYTLEPVGIEFAGALRAMPGVAVVEPWSLNDGWAALRRVRVWGLPPDTTLYRHRLWAGRWFRPGESDAAVISTDLAREGNVRLGDRLEVEIGPAVRLFRVVGIAVDNSIFLGSTVTGKVFLPTSVTERMLNRLGRASFFAVRLDDRSPRNVDRVLGQVERKFHRLRPGTIAAYSEIESSLEQTRVLSVGLGAMVGLVAVVGALGVINTLTLNVMERRREIGVLRAVGAGDGHLLQLFLTEGLALGMAGWVLGLAVGYPLGRFFVSQMGRFLFQMDVVFPPGLVGGSLLFTLLLVSLASLGPALGAARMPVQEALRHE